jgi:hypothetical protein
MALIITWLVALTLNQHREFVVSLTSSYTSPKTAEVRSSGVAQPELAPFSFGNSSASWRFPAGTTFLEGLRSCDTLNCVRDAHTLPKGNAKFNFPHFLIAGYSKSATTSLYIYLIEHPEVITPQTKEANYFTGKCKVEGYRLDCKPGATSKYLNDMRISSFSTWKVKGQKASFEATPRIFDMGPQLAQVLREKMPWVKIVVSYREPISRSISKHVMLWDKNQTTAHGESVCMNQEGNDLAYCLGNDMNPIMGTPRDTYYSYPLQFWVDHFPPEQLHVIQYEELVGDKQEYELRRLKKFLGLDVDALEDKLDFGKVNCRSCTIEPEGHMLPEELYRELVSEVKRDTRQMAYLFDKHKLADGKKWMANWEKIWKDNLDTCVNGMCKVKLS